MQCTIQHSLVTAVNSEWQWPGNNNLCGSPDAGKLGVSRMGQGPGIGCVEGRKGADSSSRSSADIQSPSQPQSTYPLLFMELRFICLSGVFDCHSADSAYPCPAPIFRLALILFKLSIALLLIQCLVVGSHLGHLLLVMER